MCQMKKLRMLMEQRLHSVVEEIFGLFERTIAAYEEELSRTKEENERQQELLDAVFKPQVVLHRADVQEVSSESQEEIPSEQQEWSSSVGQNELEPPHIKEEGEELWEQLQRLEEANDKDEAQSLQLDYSPSEENRGAELLTRHITADGEHREDINSEPDSIFAPLSDSSESNQSDNIQKPLENNRNSQDVMRHHADKKHYNCSECGKSLRHKSLFTAHMRIHTGEKPFACSDCPKRFSTNDNLKKHTHVHGAGKPFACSVCSKSLSSQRHLKRHMMIHTGENPFPCSVCPKRVKTKSQLILHMRTHTGERPFTCSVCSKGFTSKASMTHHMKSHMREEQFTCPLCPKRYTKNAALMAHMRTHTGERPFSCNVCATRFRYKYQVKRHKCSADLDAVGQCGSGDRAVIQNLEGS